jgi:V/A-type H+-transporting ATPase subunit D
MAKILEGVKPTRIELIQLRGRKEIAEKGDKILSDKRDALVQVFFERIKRRNRIHREMLKALDIAYTSLIESEMLLGEQKVKELSMQISQLTGIELESESIMGVSIPVLKLEEQEERLPEHTIHGTNAKFDETVKHFAEAFNRILELAELEGAIMRLAVEIEKTRRRANMLEYVVIPNLEATIKWIEFQLEERDREDFLRRKRIKAMMERKGKR